MRTESRSRLKSALFLLIYTGLLFEGFSLFLVHRDWWRGGLPTYQVSRITSGTFWKDLNPHFGVWHEPGAEYHHISSCVDVHYKANRHGMRDAQRELESDEPRFAVIGDSVVEGYGIDRNERFSNVLERETGVEHLNFGLGGGFGPLQYQLLYRHFASNFSHEGIVLGIYPNNDLSDYLPEPDANPYRHRYKPYYTLENGEYRIVYYRETLEEARRATEGGFGRLVSNALREFVASAHVIKFMMRLRPSDFTSLIPGRDSVQSLPSAFYDYADRQIEVMELSLNALYEAASGRPVYVFLAPRFTDFLRYRDEKTNPLARLLERWASDKNAQIVDMLSLMYEASRGDLEDIRRLYQTCDTSHWGARGNRLAADILRDRIDYEAFAARARPQ
jgi:hypothetical protein